MSFELIGSLVYNASFLLVLGLLAVYTSTGRQFAGAKMKILAGLMNGVICVVIMSTPVQTASGLTVDSSALLLGATAMFFGLEPALSCLLVFLTARVMLGGSGALSAIISADALVALGLLWNKHRLQTLLKNDRKPLAELAGMALVFAAIQQYGLLSAAGTQALNVFLTAGLPAIVVLALAALFISMVTYTRIQSVIQKEAYAEALAITVNENRELSQQLENSEALRRSLFDSFTDLVYYKDRNSIYMDCNVSFEGFVGKPRSGIVGFTDGDLFEKNLAVLRLDADKQVLALGAPKLYEEYTVNQDGEDVVLETLNTPCRGKSGEVVGLIGISRDITDRKKKEEEILYLTYHDVPTGLYNSNFIDLMRQRYSQDAPLPMSVIMCDLNGLKLINNAFGHTEGDKLLREAAAILRSSARADDIIARVGGDEFCLLLPYTDAAEVQSVADSIIAACEEFTGSDDCPYTVSLALGYATSTGREDSVDLLLRTAEDFMNKKKLLDYQSTHNSILSSIKTTMYEKSLETEEHAERLAGLSEVLGKHLGLHDEALLELKLFAMLHDIGKIGIDERILTKKEKLTDDDWLEIRKHPEIGYRITHASSDLKDISDYILYHHERWDGRGYPLGLAGNDIPLLARVLSVVDSYDAMTNDRVYRKALSETEAVAEIVRNAGSQFDPTITEIFVQIIAGAPSYVHTVME
jgi:diguanylate cyclase (GGDEF)-like protein/PAS domain S-box-containing protein